MNKILTILLLSFALPLCCAAQTWNQIGNDIEGEAPGDKFGFSTSLDDEGSTIAIGANGNDGSGYNAGHIRILDWNGMAWTQRGSDLEGTAAEDDFGHKVGISGDGNVVVGGAQFNSDDANRSGHARVFSWDSGQWVQMGSALKGVETDDYFGQSVRLSHDGQIVAVAGSGFTGNFMMEGVIRVYKWNGADWEKMGADILGDATYDRMNACDLSSDGLTVVGGSWGHEAVGFETGRVRVFTWDGQSWIQKGEDLYGEAEGDKLGSSVRLSADGNTVAMGAPHGGDGVEQNTGYVKVFNWDGAEWKQMGQNIYGETALDLFGLRIGLSGDGTKLISGALRNDGNGANSGHARVYTFENSNWVQEGEDIDGEEAGDWAGFDVDINDSGGVVAVGARHNNENGDVRVFGEIVSSLSETSPLNAINIFPNPSTGDLNVELEAGGNATIKVYALDGKILYQKKNIIAAHQFHLDAVPGLYIVEISSDVEIQKLKLVIQ